MLKSALLLLIIMKLMKIDHAVNYWFKSERVMKEKKVIADSSWLRALLWIIEIFVWYECGWYWSVQKFIMQRIENSQTQIFYIFTWKRVVNISCEKIFPYAACIQLYSSLKVLENILSNHVDDTEFS